MNKGLQSYLNDHLVGSEGAIKLVDHLIQSTEGEPGNAFFRGLKRTIKSDQQRLADLMATVGVGQSALSQIAGKLGGAASRLKLQWDGGPLGDFEALEMLALGIQGKRLLWRILDEISPHFPEWQDIDFIKLERDAVIQRDAVENLRREAGRDSLVC